MTKDKKITRNKKIYYDLDKINIPNEYEFKLYALANFFEVSYISLKTNWGYRYGVTKEKIERLFEIFSQDNYYKYRDEVYELIGNENVADVIWGRLFIDEVCDDEDNKY